MNRVAETSADTVLDPAAGGRTLLIDGNGVSLAQLQEAVVRRSVLIVAPAAWDRIAQARAVVDRIVDAGTAAYGITTGVGSQKDFMLDPDALDAYNNRMLRAHATHAPGAPATDATLRAALIIQISLFARGCSGVRPALVERMVARLNSGHRSKALLGSSVGASDIVGMAQLALSLLAADAADTDTSPMLQAKEALSLINSNALTLGQGAMELAAARRLLLVADRIAALSLEGLRGNPRSWRAVVDRVRGQPGQTSVGRRLRHELEGSVLLEPGAARFLQDPLSFRCVPQIHGAAEAALIWTETIWGDELRAGSDNPLIDVEAGEVVSHGNMETTLLSVALDALRLSLAKLIEAAGERIHKIQWPAFSGLPAGLARIAGPVGGVQFLNLGHIAAAASMAVRHAAGPASLLFHGQLDDGVEDVAGGAPFAVAQLEKLIEAAWTVIAVEAACAAWAIHHRDIPLEELGQGTGAMYRTLLPLLPIGREGDAVFDIGSVISALRD